MKVNPRMSLKNIEITMIQGSSLSAACRDLKKKKFSVPEGGSRSEGGLGNNGKRGVFSSH
jgi:hypothetical protein